MSQSKWVRVGSVRRFDHVGADKAQALKVLEEAVEVHSAWEHMRRHPGSTTARSELLDECADVIQATLNLVAAMGVEDFRPYMKACEERNRERGRITDIPKSSIRDCVNGRQTQTHGFEWAKDTRRAERTCRNLNPPSCRDFECSECGESSEFTPGFMPNYCPHCGARVVEK